jgi:NAD(P)H-hydrate epimerase
LDNKSVIFSGLDICKQFGKSSYTNAVIKHNQPVHHDVLDHKMATGACWILESNRAPLNRRRNTNAKFGQNKIDMTAIPSITTLQMAEVDKLMIEKYGISLIQMMENAGRSLAEMTRRLLGGNVNQRRIAIICGGGNNGGGGMVAARHLHNWGAEINLKVVTGPEHIKEAPRHQWHTLTMIGVEENDSIDLKNSDLVIDALIGYGLNGDPRGKAADWIEQINKSGRPILALDAPSGLNTTTGIPGNPCVRASVTLTLALPKTGLLTLEALPYTGDLYLADISVPPQLYAGLGIEVPPLFVEDTIIRI